jgi:phosphoribosylamine--glycine ligase
MSGQQNIPQVACRGKTKLAALTAPRLRSSLQRMRVLGVGHSCDLGELYLRLMAQGAEVRVYSRDLAEHGVMTGMLTHVADYRSELDWVRAAGPNGMIVFETAEHGAEQDALRRDGFAVIGGSAFGDRLENDRTFGQSVLQQAGLQTVPTRAFHSFEEAIAFVQAAPRRYVFKLNGSEASSWRNYVGHACDGSDLIALLRGQSARLELAGLSDATFVLMEHVAGIETGIGAYFDGQDFIEPACLDWEHKRLFVGDLGELTGEMGTLVTYRDSARLFQLTLAKLTPVLRAGGYVGYINLNTIINAAGIWPLELTCRFGYPGSVILSALQETSWLTLFQRMLRRTDADFVTRPGYAVGVVLTVPPFPYRYGYAELSRGLPVSLDPTLSPDERAQLHFVEVARADSGQLITSGLSGNLGVATGIGASVEDAQRAAYALAGRVYVPNLRYRTDIGTAFREHGHAQLCEWGYLTPRARVSGAD